MITYEEAKDNQKVFIALTGLDQAEFEELLKMFEIAWNKHLEEKREKKGNMMRRPGGGRKAVLSTPGDKLFFILFYFKNYPLQEVMGFLFGIGQSQVNEWIHRLTEVLKQALLEGGYLPERCPEHLIEVLSTSLEQEFAIDGTERRRQRPKDKEEQKKYYSGKRKAHTMKNDLIVDINSRQVEYLSKTEGGKKHDKKIIDEESPSFPSNSSLYKDSGFQGYEPEGVITYQPKKKPRGGELSAGEKTINSIISSTRMTVEHVISGIKRCHIVKGIFRNTKKQFDDIVMEISCGLHNFRTECRNIVNDGNLLPIFS